MMLGGVAPKPFIKITINFHQLSKRIINFGVGIVNS